MKLVKPNPPRIEVRISGQYAAPRTGAWLRDLIARALAAKAAKNSKAA